ncbi:sigma-70 family RNA polymerase sigma factor [Porticoccaceae bacterium]|nr:sigma-70 family RNA polymerase sigma factor [Porticoccaceae bacterium]
MADKTHRGKGPDVKVNKDTSASDKKTSAENNSEMTRIYSEMRTSLMRFAYRYFKTPQEIEDVVQEAFVKVIEAKQSRTIEYPKSYMFQTVKNLSLNKISKSDYRLTDALEDQVGAGMHESVLQVTSSMEDQFESRQRFELFCRAVRELPVKCQRVYIMRRVYGYTQKEIAEQLGISVKTVEAHLTKAITRCTDFMDEEENPGQYEHEESEQQSLHPRTKSTRGHKSEQHHG